MADILYSGTIESIGDGFSTKNLTIDPPVLKLTMPIIKQPSSGGGGPLRASSGLTTKEVTLTSCTWEDDKLKYPIDSTPIGSRYALVAFDNGVPVTVTVYVERESSGGGNLF